METTNRLVKGKTVMTRFKENEGLTLETLAEEYGMTFEKFLNLLQKEIGNRTFSDVKKKNEKRKKKTTGKIPNGEEVTMKATNITTNKEENIMSKKVEQIEENKVLSVEELQEMKDILELQIKAEEGSIESKNILVQMAEQEREEISERVENLKEQLSAAEGELLDKECTLEELNHEIGRIQEKAAGYQKELKEIKTKISKLTMIYLMVPYFKGKFIKDATIVSCQPKIKQDGTIDTRILVEDVENVDDFGISAFEAKKLGYKDLERFFEDCAFVCLVKSYKEAGKNYEVLTNKVLPINNLMNRVLGEGEW